MLASRARRTLACRLVGGLDLGGTIEEVAGAIGPSGYLRAMLCANQDEQIAAVARWLSGHDGTRH
jgi:hypothetical protein